MCEDKKTQKLLFFMAKSVEVWNHKVILVLPHNSVLLLKSNKMKKKKLEKKIKSKKEIF